jgi:uncharacterized membrane protein YkoI
MKGAGGDHAVFDFQIDLGGAGAPGFIGKHRASFLPGAESGPAAAPEMIGEERAMEIALNHAGVKEADVLRSTVQLDDQADPVRYAVEFRIADHRFDYQIEAHTGEILRFELR